MSRSLPRARTAFRSLIRIESVARDFATFGDVTHGNFIQGTLGQQLDEAAADRVLGAKRHVGSPLDLIIFCGIYFIIPDVGATCKERNTLLLTQYLYIARKADRFFGRKQKFATVH